MSKAETKTPTQQLRDEHVIVLEKLEALRDASESAVSRKGETSVEDRETLVGVAGFLAKDVVLHLRKEEEALFPSLEEHIGLEGGPTAVMRMEHEDLREKIRSLGDLVEELGESGEVYGQIHETAAYICDLLGEHIHKEDNILFPMAEQLLDEPAVRKVAQRFAEIGGEQQEGAFPDGKVVRLDVRQMPPWERHPKIFEVWESLEVGDTIQLVNDHNPKPLHYEFIMEREGQFDWRSEEKGPQEWVAWIKRVAPAKEKEERA